MQKSDCYFSGTIAVSAKRSLRIVVLWFWVKTQAAHTHRRKAAQLMKDAATKTEGVKCRDSGVE